MSATRAALVLLLSCQTASAGTWVTQSPESAFTYRGKPVDPRCVGALMPMERGLPKSADLSRCTGPGKATRDGNDFWIEEPDPDAIMGTPFDSYEVLARNGSRFIVSMLSSGGGSGRFSSIVLVRREGDTLNAERFFTEIGDRCNGGIAGAHVSGNRLFWSVNVTPYDVLQASGAGLASGASGLEYGAQSCVATLDSEYNLVTGKMRLVSETLTLSYFGGTEESRSGLLSDQEGWTEQFKHQHCFNTYYNSYVSKGHTRLSPTEMKAFGQGLVLACLRTP